MILEMHHEIELYLLALLASYPRMLAFLSTALIFSQSSMTRITRNGLVFILCLPLVPLNHSGIGEREIEAGSYFLMLFKEYLLGLCLGYTVGWIFWAVQAAGALIDNQRGAAIAESIDPLQGHQTSPLGNLFSQAITTYLFMTGGILFLVGVLYHSFLIWPVWNFLPLFTPEFPRLFLGILDNGMRLAFVFAAPLVLIMFIAEAALAMVSRFAPQVQVFILAMPIKSGVAMFIMIFYVTLLFPDAAGRYGQAQTFASHLFAITTPSPDPAGPGNGSPP